MTHLPPAGDALRSRRVSLEKLTNSTSRPVALFGAAALAIFNAGQLQAQQTAPAAAPQIAATAPVTAELVKPAPVVSPAAIAAATLAVHGAMNAAR